MAAITTVHHVTTIIINTAVVVERERLKGLRTFATRRSNSKRFNALSLTHTQKGRPTGCQFLLLLDTVSNRRNLWDTTLYLHRSVVKSVSRAQSPIKEEREESSFQKGKEGSRLAKVGMRKFGFAKAGPQLMQS